MELFYSICVITAIAEKLMVDAVVLKTKIMYHYVMKPYLDLSP
jgi:hypothetical protein